MASERILVVDDVKILCIALQKELQLHGYTVEFALDGSEALKKAEHSTFDLALVDVVMPEMDGFETYRRLKEIAPTTRVIMMTGKLHTGLVDDQRGIPADMRGLRFLYKPFKDGEVVQAIHEVLPRV